MHRRGVLTAIAGVTAVTAGCTGGENDDPTATPTPTPTPTPEPTPTVSYTVEEIEDISHAAAVRKEASVTTEGPVQDVSDEDLLLIAEEVIETIIDDDDVNAVVVFFYDPGADLEFAAEAKVEWAPFGEWESAEDAATGDYSDHEHHLERFS